MAAQGLAFAGGVALGGGIVGFGLAAAEEYMRLSTVITKLRREFRGVADDTTAWGQALGYTRSQTAGIVEAFGRESNSVARSPLKATMGFAREFGLDPTGTAGMFGRLTRLGGGGLQPGIMASLAGHALQQGMGEGRMAEFLDVVRSLAELQFGATGRLQQGNLGGLSELPSLVFGAGDPRALGREGLGFTERLQGVVTQGGAMRSFMMRAIGYGSEGGPSYIEMRKRLEAGLADPRNLGDLFGAFQERGIGKGGMFRAIESVAGGSLKAHEIEALVDAFGSKEGLARFYDSFLTGDAGARKTWEESLSKDERATFEKLGFGGMVSAGGRVGAGEVDAVMVEEMRMAVGGPIAHTITELREAMISLFGTLSNVLGTDIGTDVKRVADGISTLAGGLERATAGRMSAKEGLGVISDVYARGSEVFRSEGGTAELDFYRGLFGNEEIKAAHPEWYRPLGGGQ